MEDLSVFLSLLALLNTMQQGLNFNILQDYENTSKDAIASKSSFFAGLKKTVSLAIAYIAETPQGGVYSSCS